MIEEINLEKIKDIALEAGKAIIEIYKKDFNVEYKEDNSPLTIADIKSNEIICNNLKKLYPHIPILSEENKEIPYDIRKKWDYYWCIDPIDGTKEFINKNGEFTVNIALVYNTLPILGVVYAPVLEELYWAKKGSGAYKNSIKLPIKRDDNKLIVVASRSHLSIETKEFIESLETGGKDLETISKGSSLKLCMVAEGIADIYPRLAPTMEWDTAAAHAIILESGKKIIKYENSQDELTYNKINLLNDFFVVI